jgi:hypothetical protein
MDINNSSSSGESGERPNNLWVKIVSALALCYLLFSLIIPMFLKQGQQPPRKIEVPDILLITIVLIFNSVLVNKLEELGFSKDGSLTAKFKGLKQEVATLSEEIDNLLLGTVLDAFEYVTLRDLKDKNDIEFKINPSGLALLERLRNRGLLKAESNVFDFDNRSERKITLHKVFSITEQGCRYLKAVEDKGIAQSLIDISKRRMHGN